MKEPVTENFESNEPTLHNNQALHFWIAGLLVSGGLLTLFNQSLAYKLHALNPNLYVIDYLHLVSGISILLLFGALLLIWVGVSNKWLSERMIAVYGLVVSVLVIPAIAWTVIVLALSGG